MDIRVCTAESLCCSPVTITTLLMGYTPIQNKKLKKKKKNLPSSAENLGSIPGEGIKIPHAMGQVSVLTTARESPYATMKTQHSQKKK